LWRRLNLSRRAAQATGSLLVQVCQAGLRNFVLGLKVLALLYKFTQRAFCLGDLVRYLIQNCHLYAPS
jgi:hypothetical protein